MKKTVINKKMIVKSLLLFIAFLVLYNHLQLVIESSKDLAEDPEWIIKFSIYLLQTSLYVLFALSVFIILKGKLKTQELLFFLLATLLLFFSLVQESDELRGNNLYEYCTSFSMFLVPFIFIHFLVVFPQEQDVKSSKKILMIYFLPLILTILDIFLVFQQFDVIWIIIIVVCLVVSLVLVIDKLKLQKNNMNRLKTQNVFLSLLPFITFTTTFFLILVAKLSVFWKDRLTSSYEVYYEIGLFLREGLTGISSTMLSYLFAFSFIAIITSFLFIPLSFAYAILKHRLFDIKFVLKKTFAYGLLIFSLFTIFFVFTVSIAKFILPYVGEFGDYGTIFAVLGTFSLAFPVYKKVKILVDRKFYRTQFKEISIVKDLSTELHHYLDEEKLHQNVAGILSKNLHIKSISIFLHNEHNYLFEHTASIGVAQNISDFSEIPNGLIERLKKKNKEVLLYNLEENPEKFDMNEEDKSKLYESKTLFCLPIFIEEKLIGFVNFGPKKSELRYNYEEIRLLKSIVRQLSFGVELARLSRKERKFLHEAIIVTDICGFSKIASKFGNRFANNLSDRFQKMIGEVKSSIKINSYKHTGDGFLITIDKVDDAVKVAELMLQKIRDYNSNVSVKEEFHIRIGMHFGEVSITKENERISNEINTTFRIEGVAKKDFHEDIDGIKKEEFPTKDRIFLSQQFYDELEETNKQKCQYFGYFDLKNIYGRHKLYLLMVENQIKFIN